MDAQIRAILHKAGVRTPLDDEDLQAIASSASSASGISGASHGPDGAASLSASVVEGGGGSSSNDLSLASDVLRTLRSPHQRPQGGDAHPRYDGPVGVPAGHAVGAAAIVGLSEAVRRE